MITALQFKLSPFRALVLLATVAAFCCLAPDDAAAVPCFAPTWHATSPGEQIEALEGGVLVIPATIEASFESFDPAQHLDTVLVTVSDASGTESPGTTSYDAQLQALVWMPDAPLDSETTYAAHVIFDSTQLIGTCGPGGAMVELQFELTVRETTPALVAPTIDQARLSESENAVLRCCSTSEPLWCVRGPEPCDYCWTSDYHYAPSVFLRWSSAQDAVLEPYVGYRIEVVDDGEATTVEVLSAPTGDGEVVVSFATATDPYCVRITAFEILDGTTLSSETRCLDADTLEPIEHRTPPQADTSMCDELPDGEDVAEGDDISRPDDVAQGSDTADGGLGADTAPGNLNGGGGDCGCRVSVGDDGSNEEPLLLVSLAAMLVGAALVLRNRGRRSA